MRWPVHSSWKLCMDLAGSHYSPDRADHCHCSPSRTPIRKTRNITNFSCECLHIGAHTEPYVCISKLCINYTFLFFYLSILIFAQGICLKGGVWLINSARNKFAQGICLRGGVWLIHSDRKRCWKCFLSAISVVHAKFHCKKGAWDHIWVAQNNFRVIAVPCALLALK